MQSSQLSSHLKQASDTKQRAEQCSHLAHMVIFCVGSGVLLYGLLPTALYQMLGVIWVVL